MEPHERKKLKKMKAVSDSEEEEDGEFLTLTQFHNLLKTVVVFRRRGQNSRRAKRSHR